MDPSAQAADVAARLDQSRIPQHEVPALVELLLQRGLTPAEIEAHAEGDLFSVTADIVFGAGDLTARELALELGGDLDTVLEIYRLLGVPIDDPDARVHSRDEVEVLAIVHTASAEFDEGQGDDILRAASSGLTLIAETVVASFVGNVEERLEVDDGLAAVDRALLTEEMAQGGLLFGRGLGVMFRHHLRAAVRRQRAAMSATDRHLRHMAIGFVDLVGFTSLSGALDVHDLLELVRDFEARAFNLAVEHDGRVIKHIGDEVMIAATDEAAACAILLSMVEEFDAGGTRPRAGLASGDVVARQGDYYGPVVNLAARLVDEAVPGELLATTSIRDAVDERFVFEPGGRRMLKGFADPVHVVSVLRPEPT